MDNCSIYPINPFTGKDSTLYKELLSKLGNRDKALLKYGEYFNSNKELFKGEEEPPLSYFEKEEPSLVPPVFNTNSNEFIDSIMSQAANYTYNEQTKTYSTLSGGTPLRVTSAVQYFTGRETKSDFNERDLAEKEANKLWENFPKDEKQIIDGKELNYNEFIDYRIKSTQVGILKGNAIHSWLQYSASRDERFRIKALEYEAATTGLGYGGGALDYSWADKSSPVIFKNAGINLTPFGTYKADVIKPEVTVGNDIINMVGTADMVVFHDDNTISIPDWKTGSKFDNDVFEKILLYGNQSRLMKDNPRTRAKLQVALYAFIIKLNNPDAQFKNLKVCHIPNSYSAEAPFRNADVDMENILPMLESLFKDKKFLESAGLSLDTYKKIKEASPRAFIPGDYQSTSINAYSELKEKGVGPATALKIADINYLSNKSESEGLTKEEQKILANTTQEFLEMQNVLGIKLPKEIPADYEIGLITKLTGTYMDTNNPYLRSLKILQDQRMDEAVNKYTKIESRFYRLLDGVVKSDPKNSLGKVAGKYNFNSNPDFWNWAFKEIRDNEENTYSKELISDEDIELWNSLSQQQRDLLTFVHETQEKFFVGENAYLNKKVFKEGGEDYSILDWYNLQTTKNTNSFRYKKGWFAKTAMTEAEINKKNGGRLKLSTFKEKAYLMLTDFIETNYEGINQYGIPLKYLGSDQVVKSGNYSTNLEQSFLTFTKHITLKEKLDDVYALAQGIKAIHQISENKNENVLFKNTLQFIDDRVLADLVGRVHRDGLFRIPFILNKKGQKLDVYKIMAFLKKIATFSIMGIMPFNGLKNGVFASMVNYRNGRVNWAGSKFAGIEGDEMSYTPQDLARANALVTEYMGQTMKGNYRSHKIWHLAKQSRYLTHDILNKAESSYISKGNTSSLDASLSFYSIPEEWNSLSVMVAQMLHMKTKNGKSVYDEYKVVDGQLIWEGGVRGYTENTLGEKIPLKELNSLEFGKMRRVYERLHGQYRQDERATAELYIFGSLAMMFARHVATYFRNNLGEATIDDYQGKYKKKGTYEFIDELGNKKTEDVYEWISEVNRGRYILLYEWVMGIRSKSEWSDLERRTVLEGSYSLISSFMFAALAALMSGMLFDDDDDEDSPQQKLLDGLVRDYGSPTSLSGSLGLAGTKNGNIISSEVGEIFQSFQKMSYSFVGYKTGLLSEDMAKTRDGYYKGEKRFVNRLPLVRNMTRIDQFLNNDGDRYIFDSEE